MHSDVIFDASNAYQRYLRAKYTSCIVDAACLAKNIYFLYSCGSVNRHSGFQQEQVNIGIVIQLKLFVKGLTGEFVIHILFNTWVCEPMTLLTIIVSRVCLEHVLDFLSVYCVQQQVISLLCAKLTQKLEGGTQRNYFPL